MFDRVLEQCRVGPFSRGSVAVSKCKHAVSAMVVGRIIIPLIGSARVVGGHALEVHPKQSVIDRIRMLVDEYPGIHRTRNSYVGLFAENSPVLARAVLVYDVGLSTDCGHYGAAHLAVHRHAAHARTFGAIVSITGTMIDGDSVGAVRRQEGVDQKAVVII